MSNIRVSFIIFPAFNFEEDGFSATIGSRCCLTSRLKIRTTAVHYKSGFYNTEKQLRYRVCSFRKLGSSWLFELLVGKMPDPMTGSF